MKHFFALLLILITISPFFSDDLTGDDYSKLKNEMDNIKKELNILKERNNWFSFLLEGSTKVIWGVSLWAVNGEPKKAPVLNTKMPITNGFDFENNVKFKMNLGNQVVHNSLSKSDDGTEIIFKLKFESLGVSQLMPRGSWYLVDATDDTGKRVSVYFPKYDNNGTNVLFGNIQLVIDQARVSKIAGTGFFFDYSDITQVHEYYGVNQMVDTMTLNHKFFNNGYFADTSIDGEYSNLYYSFDINSVPYLKGDSQEYPAESGISEGVQLWSNAMLRENLNDSRYNQRPHGFAMGYEDRISKNFAFSVYGGGASKDAFDPKFFEDSIIDYGFFLRGSINISTNKFNFYPKLSLSFAFQTNTTEDYDYGWSTFAAGLNLPLEFNLPTGESDKFKLEFNYNINAFFALSQVATMFSIFPELTVLDKKLFFKFPILYSFKNGVNGFLRVGNDSVKQLDQLYENHVFSFSFIAGFDSRNLFGDIFRLKVSNQLHFTNLYVSFNETYFYEIFRTEFIADNIPDGPTSMNFYLEFGYGFAQNARLIDSQTNLKYQYDYEKDAWVDVLNGETMKWRKLNQGNVLRFETGFIFDIIKNLQVGFSAESPYLLLSAINPIGAQQSFGVFKLWSEIKF